MNRIAVFIIITGLLSACTKKLQDLLVSFPEETVNIKIHSSNTGLGPCEPSICISPYDPNVVIAGSVLNNYYVSEDGGKSWSKNILTSTSGVYGDPVIRIDNNGNIYYAHLSNPGGRAYKDDSFLDRIVVQKSSDNGTTWTDGSYPSIRGKKDQDKEWLYIDPSDGTILMSWTEFDKYASNLPEDKSRILFSKSMDQGLSWSDPISVNEKEGDCLDDDNTTEGAMTTIGTDGTYYMTWAFDNKIYFDKSVDKGATWMPQDKNIATQVNGWSQIIPGIGRCNGMPTIGCDISSNKFKGRIYVNWTDQRNGEDNTDVWVISSGDGGESWSEPVMVNNDNSNRHQFFSWMDVDPITGIVYLVFYDRRETSGNATDVFLAYSSDGGKTFLNKKISESSFTPSGKIFFGDYNDISAYNGMVRPIWTRYENGSLSVWTAMIDIK